MLRLNGFAGRPLQNVLQFLAYAEGQGVTDIRVIRTEIEEYLRKNRKRNRLQMSKEGKIAAYKKKIAYKNNADQAAKLYESCPSCKKGLFKPKVALDEGEIIYSCRTSEDDVGCGYSQVVVIGK